MYKDCQIHVIVEGEPFLQRFLDYRKEYEKFAGEWNDFATKYGAERIFRGSGLYFNWGKQPDGWTKPQRNGFSRPKKGTEAYKEMMALMREPTGHRVLEGAYIGTIVYEGGMKGIDPSFFREPLGWFGDVNYAVIPDAALASKMFLIQNPDAIITNGADKWVLPDGLRQVTKGEFNLMKAKYEVENEKRNK